MAEYLIIADSSCELPNEYIDDERFSLVPFNMDIDGEQIKDVKGIDILELLRKIAACKTCPRSSCPSPDNFVRLFEAAESKRIYVVTISSHLSGCFNSANIAKMMYEEEHDDKQIFVIDSLSASGGESLLAIKAYELEEQGLPFETICDNLTEYRNNITTYVVLDNLETFRKNGRISRVDAIIASSLRIKPLLQGVKGELEAVEKAIGLRKAWNAMTNRIIRETAKLGDNVPKRIIITHCNNLAGAERVRDTLKASANFKEYIIMQTSGLSSLYANDGGIIVTY